MDCQTIGLFIAQLRKEANLTQAELAKKLGVTSAAISKWECGRCYPDIELLSKIARVFSVDVAEILSGHHIIEYTKETVSNISNNEIQEYMHSMRKQIWRKAIISVSILLIPLLLILPFTTRYFQESIESCFSTEYYNFSCIYESPTVDIGQLIVQYNLNGESCSVAVSTVIEKQESSITFIDCIKSIKLDHNPAPFDFSCYCAPSGTDLNEFQIVITASAKERENSYRTTTTDIYTIIYKNGVYNFTKV